MLEKTVEKELCDRVKNELGGGPAYVWGVRQLVSGMVYNLCDNAIKYNRENGSVKLTVSCEGSPAFSLKANVRIPSSEYEGI